MYEFSPKAFADWLNEAFQDSHFKSFSDLADAVGLSRATVSSYATARPQTASNKASRPKRENVIGLAEALKKDVNEALLIAGHAPANASNIETMELDEHVRVQLLGAKGFSEQDKREYMDALQVAVEIAKRRIADRNKQDN